MALERFNRRKNEAFSQMYGKELNRLVCEFIVSTESENKSMLSKAKVTEAIDKTWKSICDIYNSKPKGAKLDKNAFLTIIKDEAYLNKIRGAFGLRKTLRGRLKQFIINVNA